MKTNRLKLGLKGLVWDPFFILKNLIDLRSDFFYPYIIPGPFFIAHAAGVVIAKIIKKTGTGIEIVFSFILPLVSFS